MKRKTILNLILAVSVVLSIFTISFTPSGSSQAAAGVPSASSTASNQAQQSLVLPSSLPVFAIMPTLVNSDIIMGNSMMLNQVLANDTASQISPGGLTHFFAFNQDTGDIVDQFNRTGGLFAVNYTRAYSEQPLEVNPSGTQICLFLANRKLFPADIESQFTNCRGAPSYPVKQIHLSTENPGSGEGTNSVIGELVQVPLAINIGQLAPLYIPMGGPGGHLSLLIAGNANMPSLDSSLPGLQALASPWFDRIREPNPIGTYPIVPMLTAIQRFKANYPAADVINPGTPVMVYYVGFPDAPQDAVMPMWTFPDATEIISGTTVFLKDSAIPGVEGFAPAVNISSPADGSVFLKDKSVSLTFSITGDQGPFTYTISADSSQIVSGVFGGGTLTLNLGKLPQTSDRPEGHSITVHAVNKYNIPGDDTVFLGTVSNAYLPIVGGGNSAAITALAPAATIIPDVSAPESTLKIGVEWVMNYHSSANLAQTQPDAEGLYSWLGVMGWSRTFNYGNDSAWEKDWRDCALGGGDCTYGVDRAQFAYFSGHGSPAAFYFGISRDSTQALAANARFQNVRWSAFSSCQTVRGGPYVGPGNPPLTAWFSSFQGSYMVLGFHSVMGDIPFGGTLGFNLDNPVYHLPFFSWLQPTVAQAWVNTAFQMNAGKPAYLYAVGNFDPSGFKLPPAGSGPLPPLTGITQFRWVWWDE